MLWQIYSQIMCNGFDDELIKITGLSYRCIMIACALYLYMISCLFFASVLFSK